MEASCCRQGGRKERVLSAVSLPLKGQARSRREQPATCVPVACPCCQRMREAVNLPGAGLHLRCSSVCSVGILSHLHWEPKRREVSVPPHPAATALSLEAVCATVGDLPAPVGTHSCAPCL